MNYRLKFLPIALKEWDRLAPQIKFQFKKKLVERLKNPHVPSAKLHTYENVYKIKLRAAGFRLVYEVVDKEIVVYVLVVGKRDKNAVYKKLATRVDKLGDSEQRYWNLDTEKAVWESQE